MPQAVDRKLLLYAEDTCLIFQRKDITKIETALNISVCSVNGLQIISIHFGEKKTKSILFCNRRKIKNSKALTIQYNDIKSRI